MSELEVCASIAAFAGLIPAGSSFDACVDAAKINRPPRRAGGRNASPANARGACRRGRVARKKQQRYDPRCFFPLSDTHLPLAARACALHNLQAAFPLRGMRR
eukprot:9492089-Pyramimonas_sp.AAC.1